LDQVSAQSGDEHGGGMIVDRSDVSFKIRARHERVIRARLLLPVTATVV
jgi:hypothetical protein